MKEESVKNGAFTITNASKNRLFLEISDFDFQYKYFESFLGVSFVFGYFTESKKELKPEKSILKIKAKLVNSQNTILLEKEYSSNILNDLPAESVDIYSGKKLPKDIMYNFESSLNENTKALIQAIIKDVNKFL